jgi:hypothetical protein
MHAQAGPVILIRGWLVAGGLGALAGSLVGFWATEGYTHAQWPVLAGFALGVVGSLVAPTRPVLVALCGAAVAVVTAVTTMAAVHYQNGFWPITDEFRIAHFGSTTQAIMRAVVLYGAMIGIPCLLAAVLLAATERRQRWAAQQARGADESRGTSERRLPSTPGSQGRR